MFFLPSLSFRRIALADGPDVAVDHRWSPTSSASSMRRPPLSTPWPRRSGGWRPWGSCGSRSGRSGDLSSPAASTASPTITPPSSRSPSAAGTPPGTGSTSSARILTARASSSSPSPRSPRRLPRGQRPDVQRRPVAHVTRPRPHRRREGDHKGEEEARRHSLLLT